MPWMMIVLKKPVRKLNIFRIIFQNHPKTLFQNPFIFASNLCCQGFGVNQKKYGFLTVGPQNAMILYFIFCQLQNLQIPRVQNGTTGKGLQCSNYQSRPLDPSPSRGGLLDLKQLRVCLFPITTDKPGLCKLPNFDAEVESHWCQTALAVVVSCRTFKLCNLDDHSLADFDSIPETCVYKAEVRHEDVERF